MNKIIISVLFLILISGFSYAGDHRIEDLSMTENSGGFITTRGMVRNLETIPIRGHMEIDFLNENNDIIYSMRAYVNNNKDIPPGKAAFFENTIHKDSAPGVESVRVKFIER